MRRIRRPRRTGDTFRAGEIVFMGVLRLACCFCGREGRGMGTEIMDSEGG
ncbi:MAG: hypothetical protein ACKPJD_21165 [Planctomycetaceae bacterium]